ncbi:MAG TPA: foldase [Gammaproteobacteria bacterium]|nr:foldase [Gammaproteobacteria bacterium]
MKARKQPPPLRWLLPLFTALWLPVAGICSQVLVTVDGVAIDDGQLDRAMASAPFATRFPSLDEEQQALLRGNMLLRLVDAELLRREALARGIDRRPDFREELEHYRTALLYRKYIRRLRASIVIPEPAARSLKQRFADKPDVLAAARASYITKRFRKVREQRFAELGRQYRVEQYPQRLDPPPAADTVVARGSFFTLRYADLEASPAAQGEAQTLAQQKERLQRLVETLVAARAARDSGIDVEPAVESYRQELLPQTLIRQKEQEWIPDEATLRDYYQRHPEIGTIPERRHIGQLVLPDCRQAGAMRDRILAGESLFALARDFSIDPEGRKRAGDLGWLPVGSGYPAIEQALEGLQDGEISKPVRTPRGCHIVTILERKPASQRPYVEIRDRVRQALLSERTEAYLKRLAGKYEVDWKLPTRADKPTPAAGRHQRPEGSSLSGTGASSGNT